MMSTLNNITEAEMASQGSVMTKNDETPALPAGARKGLPAHPGEIVGGILDDIGVSVRAAATAMGISHNALANVVRGDAAISPDMAVRLGAYMGNGPEGDAFWLRLQTEHDLWHARKRLKGEAAKIKPAPREPKVA